MNYDWQVKIKAPKNPGTYFAEFEMQTVQGVVCRNSASNVNFDIKVEVVDKIKASVPPEVYTTPAPNQHLYS